jgi:hypothetical protein
MDAKEFWIIQQLHSRISSGTFADLDVMSLLIVLRQHAMPNSSVREFGDFIAHRARDQGILKKYLRRVQLTLQGNVGPEDEPIRLPVFTVEEIQASLNGLFHKLGLAEIDSELANRITVCIITILQSVEVKTKLPIPVRGFAVGVSTSQIALLGHGTVPDGHVMSFPMLVARNSYEPVPNMPMFMCLDRIVEASCSNGHFEIHQHRRAV